MARSSRKEVAEHHSANLIWEELPEGWTVTKLAEVAPVQTGYAFKSSWFSEHGIRLLRGTNIVPGGTRWEDEVRLPESRRGEFADYELIEGDTVLAMDRPVISGGLKVTRISASDLPALLLQRVARFQPCQAVEPSLLYSFVNSDLFLQHVGATATGTQLPHISSTDIGTTPIALPPLNEQKRIVAKIDVLTSRSQEARQALEEVPALLDKLRQSILAAAFRGDLTKKWREQNPNVEPASVLLDRIRQERRRKWEEAELAKFKAKGKVPTDDKWKDKYVEPEPVDTEGLPELPEGWGWASFGSLFEVKVGATPSRKMAEYWNGGIPWVSSGEVAFCRIRSTRETISEEGLRNCSTNICPKGTVLLGMIGEGKTRGQTAILDVPASTNQNIAALLVSETEIDPSLVYRFLQYTYEITRTVGSGNNQPALNKSRVQAMMIPLPPAAEQLVLLVEVERLLREHNALGDQLDGWRELSDQLDSSILAKAFRGELVPQDPNDEPASVLLERIRKEREAAGSVKKSRGKKNS